VGAAMARELGNNTVAHDAPKVWMFRGCGYDAPLPIKSDNLRSWKERCCRPFREFAGGRMACRSFGVASEHFVEYFLLLLFWRSVKNFTVWTSLAKFFKKLGRIEVKLLTLKQLYTGF
jgi:hypothetical protein